MEIRPLDAVITGCAFEEATSAIGVLEAGSGGKGKISAEMVCTLDNFVQALLFNERVFLTGSAHLVDNKICPGGVLYGGGAEGRKLIEAAGIFSPFPLQTGDPGTLGTLVDTILKPVETLKTNWFVVSCALPGDKLVINQEMASLDAFYIEDAIARAGAERFKPVFPGENLYLGLRGQRLPLPRVTQTLSDLVGARLRGAIRSKMEKLNVFVPQGAAFLPELFPIYVTRIVRDSGDGADFVRVLLEIRNSPAMRRFRAWLAKCAEQSLSPDLATRAKAADALQKFTDFPLETKIDRTEAGLGVLNVAVDVIKADVLGVLGEVAGPIVNFFLSAPFRGLRQFGGDKVEPAQLDAFLSASFGDQFNRTDMNMISYFLKLPGNLKDWAQAEAKLSTGVGRIYLDRDPLARSYVMTMRDPNVVPEVMKDWDDLKKKSLKIM